MAKFNPACPNCGRAEMFDCAACLMAEGDARAAERNEVRRALGDCSREESKSFRFPRRID